MPESLLALLSAPRRVNIKASIFNTSEGGAVISLRSLPFGPMTTDDARWIGRQIIQAANAADQGEVGTYPQEGL